ncbi:MAG: hypothetical protein DHS20C15_01060 [Planctomycetota bacterium]|nr:MAG: hypothetical protein DHS20C15_01060 [Planctomycetota bacterium]
MRNSLLPTLAVLVLLALVVLIPEPETVDAPLDALPAAETAGEDVAEALLELSPLELYRPPDWARQQGGRDAVKRSLDRLSWGPHAALLASRDQLEAHQGSLVDEILARLTALGDSDPILVSKLIATIRDEDAADPRVLEELNRRCLSPSGLVTKAALRKLARVPYPEALGGALARRHDAEEPIRELARAVLAEAVRRGDPEARAYLLQDLRERPSTPNQIDIAALGDAPYDAETMDVLQLVLERAPITERFATLGALVRHGDERAIAQLEEIIAGADHMQRFNALFVVAMAGRPIAQDSWRDIVRRGLQQETSFLMSVLTRSIQLGDADAPLAFELLEDIANNPGHSSQVTALDVLYRLGDPWALERTRDELQREQGGFLNQTVDRIMRGPRAQAIELADVAEQRFADAELGKVEQVILLNMLAQLKPQSAVEPVIAPLMAGEPLSRENVLPALVALGEVGLERLSTEVGDDRGAGLYVLAASHVRAPSALPVLERIATDPERATALRRYAIDGIVRLSGGEREGALRRIAEASPRSAVSDRVMLLFWNYL